MRDGEIFTTGEVGKICGVAPRTVTKWFDAGHLRGYHVPGSKDRRIPRQALVDFLRANDIPVPHFLLAGGRVLLVGCNGLAGRLRPCLPAEWAVREAADVWEAAATYHPTQTRAVVVDAAELGRDAARLVAYRLGQQPNPPRVVLLAPEDGGLTLDGIDRGVTDVLQHPVDPQTVARLLMEDTPRCAVPTGRKRLAALVAD